MKRKKKSTRAPKILLILVLLYIGSYSANSMLGGYWMRPERAAKARGAAASSDQIEWQPRIGFVSRASTDVTGYIFWPLVQLDRRFVHHSRDLADENTFVWADSLPPAKIHPLQREEIRKGRAEASKAGDL